VRLVFKIAILQGAPFLTTFMELNAFQPTTHFFFPLLSRLNEGIHIFL